MKYYVTLDDLVQHEITEALGDYADDYDIRRFVDYLRNAGLITYTPGTGFAMEISSEQFWTTLAYYDISGDTAPDFEE